MKNYILLSLVAFLTTTLLIFFYLRGETKLSLQHSEILALFSEAKEIESVVERDLLKSRNFILQNYDTLAGAEVQLNHSM